MYSFLCASDKCMWPCSHFPTTLRSAAFIYSLCLSIQSIERIFYRHRDVYSDVHSHTARSHGWRKSAFQTGFARPSVFVLLKGWRTSAHANKKPRGHYAALREPHIHAAQHILFMRKDCAKRGCGGCCAVCNFVLVRSCLDLWDRALSQR